MLSSETTSTIVKGEVFLAIVFFEVAELIKSFAIFVSGFPFIEILYFVFVDYNFIYGFFQRIRVLLVKSLS